MQFLNSVPAPAKLNLFLHVVGQRADGYHLLETVFRFIDLCDFFDFERTNDGVISRQSPSSIPVKDDLALQAAAQLQKATKTNYGVKISYKKQIPMGGGLGGGSSNAATVLIALNRLWNTGLTRKDLLGLALGLGADVPVFVFGKPAFARGIGEKLTAVDVQPKAYLLVKPRAKVSTIDVFSQQDLTRDSESVKISSFTDWQTSHQGFFGNNDLQGTVFKMHPVISEVWHFLTDLGINARMTGSGACLFAQYDSLSAAKMQQNQIISKIGLQSGLIENTWVCQGLVNHPLSGWLID